MVLKKIVKRVFPKGTKRFALIKRAAVVFRLAKPYPYDPEYERWIKYIEPERFSPIVKSSGGQTLFSIIIPFYNTPEKYLIPLIDSIRGQAFQGWELIMADASTDPKRAEEIKAISQKDERLKYHRVKENNGISANTNVGLSKASAKYIVFCDHDDTLSPYALNEVASKLQGDSSIDIFYSDEDKLSDNGKWRHSPLFKPGWSPHMFLNTNYTNHLSIIKKELVDGVGGLRPELDGSQDYDLLLRIHRKHPDANVCHIDKVLYHWREAAGSTAINHNSKSYAFEAGRKALQEYIDAGKVKSVVTNIPQRPGFYKHQLTPVKIKKATIFIALDSRSEVNELFLQKVEQLTDQSVISATFFSVRPDASLKDLKTKSKTDAIFIFRKEALPCEVDWLTRLCGVLELPDAQAVAPCILNADLGRIVDMGLVDDGSGAMLPLLKGLAANDLTHIGHAEWVRDVDRLSGAVEGFLVSKQNGKDQDYNVVWSYVTFRSVPILRSSRYFNGNVYTYTSHKGKVRINGEQ